MTRRARLLLLTAAFAATAPAWLATAATGEPTPSPTPSISTLPVLVTMSGLTPLAPQPGDTLSIRGSLTNQSTGPVSDLSVRLAVSRTKIGSRSEFDDFAGTPDGAAPADAGYPATQTSVLDHTALDVGDHERFSVSVPVDDLQLPEVWQVYELTVVVTGDTVTGSAEVGRLRTFLPWAPLNVPGVGKPTPLAWVWPLADRPHRTDASTWLDDSLASSFATGGRLANLLAAGNAAEQQTQPAPLPSRIKKGRHRAQHVKPPPPRPTMQPVPVTWAIDPQLVDDATVMRRGSYTVTSAAGQRPGRGSAAANQWLNTLTSAVGRPTGQLFGLPYGDPDVVAAARAGLGDEIGVANSIGDKLLEDTLHTTPLPYAWPPNGLIDLRTLDTLFAAGEQTIVLDSAAVPAPPPSVTPGAHATVRSHDGNFDALLADDTLNQVVDNGAHSSADGPLAIQRLLSELLMIQAEQPCCQRPVVITPSRRWAPTASYADDLLADTGKVPWIQPILLSHVAAGAVDDSVQRTRVQFTTEDRGLLLSRGYLARVARLKHVVDAFTSIVPLGDPVAGGFRDGVLRLLSSAWRADPALAGTTRQRLTGTVLRTRDKVKIASQPNSLVTLTSHSGNVPVTISNDLDSPVHIVVRIEPDQHLVVKSASVVRTIPAHRQLPVDIRATAQTSGVFRLTVRLATPPPDSRHYGPLVPLRVRSTAYGATALLITGGATAVLLLTVVVRLVRRARAARRTAPAAS